MISFSRQLGGRQQDDMDDIWSWNVRLMRISPCKSQIGTTPWGYRFKIFLIFLFLFHFLLFRRMLNQDRFIRLAFSWFSKTGAQRVGPRPGGDDHVHG